MADVLVRVCVQGVRVLGCKLERKCHMPLETSLHKDQPKSSWEEHPVRVGWWFRAAANNAVGSA
jgi:hypothetical protein